MRTIAALICVLASWNAMYAQIVVDAGKDTLTLCQGQTAQLGGSPTALGGRAPYRYQWDPPLGLSDPTSPNPILTALRSNQRYILTVTDADGAIGRDTVLLLMFVPPRIAAGGAVEVCVGQDVVLGGSPTAYGGQQPYRYEWLGLPPNALNVTSSNPTFRAERVQQLTVVLHVTDDRGCDAYDTARITVTQPIVLALQRRSVEICAGEPIQVGANPLAQGGTPPYRVAWSPTTGISSTDVPNPTLFPSTTTMYYCTVSDAKGCVRTDSVLVRVKPAMTVTLRDTSICFGKEIRLGDSALVSGGVPPYQFTWEAFDDRGRPVSDTFDRTAIAQFIVPPASRVYRLTVRDAQGCTQRATMTVTVTEPPIAEFALPPEICQGKTIIFGTVFNRLFDYQWQIEGAGGTILGDATSNVVRIRWDSSGVSRVSLVVRDRGKGCDYAAEASVRVHPLPQPVIAVVGRQHLCPGETTTLDAGAGYTSYMWSNGSTNRRITISDQQAGTYTVTVTDSNGCVNTSPPQLIRANTTPRPTISGPTKFCAGTTIELRATPGFARYEWSTGETTPTIAVSQPGTFTVTVYDSIGCPGASQPFTTEFNPVSMSGGGDNQFLNRETLLDYPEQTIYFVNTDDEPLTLSAVRITPYYPDLRIARLDIDGRTIASVAGAVLRVGERLNIHLKYSPQVPDTAVVRVELDVLLPCPWTYVQPIVLSSYDKRVTTIAKVVDTHGTIGSDVTIPITLELVNPQDSIIDATIEYTVRINGRMFDLRSIAPGRLLDATIASDGWYTIRIVREGITLRTVEPQLLGAITGTGLASRLFRDSVIIASLVVRDVLKQPIVQVRNGVLTLGAYCFPREIVVSQTATSVEVQPNPASSEAVVMLRNVVAGTYVVELTSLSGESLLRYRTELSPSPTWTIPIPLLGMSSGVAVVTVTTPIGTYRTFLVIAK
ncbi:MAG: hypothetical protein N3B17_05765 [Chlorobi bacterium]|nr:hypothetical protein [Chlorobiota bacterium]